MPIIGINAVNSSKSLASSENDIDNARIEGGEDWGIQVVSANIGGIKEMLTDGVVGYHFDPHDKEKALFTTPILTSRYCAQEKLNWVREYLGEEWLENRLDKVHLK